MYKISAKIENICKELGIDYKSPHHGKMVERHKDAMKLAEAYLQLKEIIGLLAEMETKYPKVNGLVQLFKDDIKFLEKIDHDIFIEAHKIAKQSGEE